MKMMLYITLHAFTLPLCIWHIYFYVFCIYLLFALFCTGLLILPLIGILIQLLLFCIDAVFTLYGLAFVC